MIFFLRKTPKFAIRKCGEIAPPYARLAKNGQKAPLQNCEKKGARGCGAPIHAPRAHFLLSSIFLVSSFRFLLSFCFCRLPAFSFFPSSFLLFLLSYFLSSPFLSFFLLSSRTQGARSCNGRSKAAPILANGGGGVPKYRDSRKIGRIFRGRKLKKRPRKL